MAAQGNNKHVTERKIQRGCIATKRDNHRFSHEDSQKNEGDAPQYYVENGHPAIIHKSSWDEIQLVWSGAPRRNCTYEPLGNKIVCGECGGLYGRKTWHSTITHDIVWECNSKKAGRTSCACCHVYEEELIQATYYAVTNLMNQYPDIACYCREIFQSMLDNIPKKVSDVFDEINESPRNANIVIDRMMVRILITEVVVTQRNLIFHFLDGSTFRCKIGIKSPKGLPGKNLKEKLHKDMLSLQRRGYSAIEIAKVLSISVNTVRSFFRRHNNKSTL